MRRHDELVQVHQSVGAARPDAFLWRGRFYAIREIHATWLEREAWWEAESWQGGESGSRLRSLPLERRVWRVEAAAGQSGDSGVFDLAESVDLFAPVGEPTPVGVGAIPAQGGVGTAAVPRGRAPAQREDSSRWRLLCRLD